MEHIFLFLTFYVRLQLQQEQLPSQNHGLPMMSPHRRNVEQAFQEVIHRIVLSIASY